MASSRWKRRGKIAGLVLLGVVTALCADYWLYPRFHQPDPMRVRRGGDGIWLRYTWYFQEHSDAEVDALASRLSSAGISNAFFHVRFIRKDGSLAYRFPDKAKSLLSRLRTRAPGIRPIAWIFAGNPKGGGEVDLARASVRKAMVAEARWLVEECGFSGVQWDYEACEDGDPNLLRLLRETRLTLPKGAVLSVAAPVWMPTSSLGWSEAYFAKVAQECDQVAVMCYDTGMLLPRAYVWLVAQQVVRVTRAAGSSNPACRVLFGLPTYEAGLRSHNPHAENLRMALRGIEEGVQPGKANMAAFGGIAPFADYTMDEAEWRLLRQVWLPAGP